MPVFPKPSFVFAYDISREIRALRAWKTHRGVPPKTANQLLLATWNIANFGAQARRDSDYRLLAEIVGWFDVVALQECRDDLTSLRSLLAALPKTYRTVFTDVAGNSERMVYVYDSRRVRIREQVGEVAIPPSQHRWIRLPGMARKFSGFDRNPFLQSFVAGQTNFTLVNVHLYYGSETSAHIQRRQLETFALARWAKRENASSVAFDPNVVLLGDFNLPFMADNDPIYSVLRRHGLQVVPHSSEVGATLPSETRGRTAQVRHYDQIALFPGSQGLRTGAAGVFDFDGAVFRDLWQTRRQSQFNTYVRYYLSDHRPLWTAIQI